VGINPSQRPELVLPWIRATDHGARIEFLESTGLCDARRHLDMGVASSETAGDEDRPLIPGRVAGGPVGAVVVAAYDVCQPHAMSTQTR